MTIASGAKPCFLSSVRISGFPWQCPSD